VAVSFEVLSAVAIHYAYFTVTNPCCSMVCVYRQLDGKYCHHMQG